MRRRSVAVLTLAGAVIAAAPAAARPHFPGPDRPPIVMRVGGRAGVTPQAVVSPSGIVELAWNTETGVALCRITAGGSRCRPRAVIRDGIDAFREPPLVSVAADGAVRLISCDAGGSPVLFASRGSGRRLERVGPLGRGQFFGGAFGPGRRVLLTDDEDGLGTLVSARAGRPRAAFATHDSGILENSGSAGWAGSTPVVAGAVSGGAFAWHWSVRGSASDPHRWMRQRLRAATHTAMAGGPRGLFLLQDGANPAGPDLLRLWHWRGERLVQSGRLPRSASSGATEAIALAQDGHGTLVAAWQESATGQLDVAASVDGGRRWGTARVIAGELPPIVHLTLAVGRGGRGIIGWDSDQGGVSAALITTGDLRRPLGASAARTPA